MDEKTKRKEARFQIRFRDIEILIYGYQWPMALILAFLAGAIIPTVFYLYKTCI